MDNFTYKENCFSFVFYGLLIFTTVYFGSLVMNKSDKNDFYTNFMLEWKHIMLNYQYSGIPLPEFDKQKPVAYMKALSNVVANRELVSNRPDFMHEIKLSDGRLSKVFLLAQADVLHIYGLDKNMVDNLDRMIDKKNNLSAGHWLAFKSKLGSSYHAIWFYKKS